MNTTLIHVRNITEPPKYIKKDTKVTRLTKDNLVKKRNSKVVVGTRDKVIFLGNPKKEYDKGNRSIPMYTKVYTHVYSGRTKEFYANPEWRVKADAIRAHRKKPFADFLPVV